MSIDWFNASEADANEVCWLRDFIAAGGDYESPKDVEACFVGLKGILVVTEVYKAFIFKGSKLYALLIEALPTYLETSTGNAVLVCCSDDGGKLQLGLDQLRLESIWKKDGQGYFQQIKTTDELAQQRLKKPDNPLIAKSSSPS